MALIARIWWLSARRRWRQNSFLLVIALGITLVHGYHTLALKTTGQLTSLFGAALAVALFLPVQLRGESILASPRFALFPYTPRFLFLLRPLFGNPFRVLLTVPALGWGIMGQLSVGRGNPLVEALQLFGWTLLGMVAAEIVDESLRRRPSLLVYQAALLVFAFASAVLAEFSEFRVWADVLDVRLERASSALLVGGHAGVVVEVLLALVLLGMSTVLLALGRRLAERWQHSVPRQEPRILTGFVTSVAQQLAPWAPASLAKELAMVLRVVLMRINFVWIIAVTAITFYAGAPFLLAAAFGLWIGFVYNLLGPDVPGGGLTRYHLLPAPLSRVFAYRHLAIILVSLGCALGTALVAGVLGWWKLPVAGAATPIAYPAWLLYGASLVLLFAVTGDYISEHFPRRIAVRNLLEENDPPGGWGQGVLTLFALGATGLVAGAVLAGWAAAPLPLSDNSAMRVFAALPLAALTHGGIYLLHLRRRYARG